MPPRQGTYSFPTIHISCPCNESIAITPKSPTKHPHPHSLPATNPPPAQEPPAAEEGEEEEEEEEGETFDPRSARSNFSLFPLDNLLYCEDCNQIRCPRCVHDEIVCFFCPNCLFEVPASTVKSEGNRCTRNCFSCPICFASLCVAARGEEQSGPYVLLCNHCLWSSSEIGIEFEKPTSITAQLMQRLKPPSSTLFRSVSGSFASPLTPVSVSSDSYFPSVASVPGGEGEEEDGEKVVSAEERFARLKTHYAQQRAGAGVDEYGSSPGALSRLMGLYSGLGGSGRSRSFGRGVVGFGSAVGGKGKLEWTEWEGVQEVRGEEECVEKIRRAGFGKTTDGEQRAAQSHCPRFVDEARPIATLLRSKRSKRCRACRHILVKPEPKVTSTRFRIKLVAINYIPALSISRLDPTAVNYHSLTPLSTHQFLLTITNPLFDPINVTLATPVKTPGRHPSTVTILCPDFEVGANTDVWDEALQSTTTQPTPTIKKGKKTGMLIGTVWDAGRNWATVVIEVVPPLLPSTGEAAATEEERLVQIPVSVRVVYETDLERDGGGGGLGREAKERREQTYWSVLGVGRVGERLPVKKVEDVTGASASLVRPASMMTATTGKSGVASGRHVGEETAGSRVNRHSVK